MLDFEIEKTKTTPKVVANFSAGELKIEGRSMMSVPSEFYEKTIQAAKEYAQNPLINTHITFNLEYFNTTSHQNILHILLIIKSGLSANHTLSVKWLYNSEDDEMRLIGKEISDITEIPFSFEEIQSA